MLQEFLVLEGIRWARDSVEQLLLLQELLPCRG